MNDYDRVEYPTSVKSARMSHELHAAPHLPHMLDESYARVSSSSEASSSVTTTPPTPKAIAFTKRLYALKKKLWWLNIGLLIVWIVLIYSARYLFFHEFPFVMNMLLIFLPVVAVAYHIYYDYERRDKITTEQREVTRLQDRSQRDESNRYNMGIATFSFAILITSVFTSVRLDHVVQKAHQIIIIVLLLTSLIFISGVPGIAHYMVFNAQSAQQLLIVEHISYVSMTFGFCMYLGACFYAIYCLFYYHIHC